MANHRKKRDSDNPQPLNFDHDEEKGPGDRLKKPFMTPAEERGDDENDQTYETEEALSPEETKLLKEEGDL